MKRIIICALLFIVALNSHAQWFYKSYGVTNINDLSESQLKLALQDAEKKIKTGKTLTFIGIGSTILGSIIYADAMSSAGDSWDEFWNSMSKGGAGLLIASAGTASMAIGIPFWIVGVNRKNSIEVTLVNFNSSSYLRSKQSAILGYNPQTSIGLSLKINF